MLFVTGQNITHEHPVVVEPIRRHQSENEVLHHVVLTQNTTEI